MGRRLEDGTWMDSSLHKVQPGEPFFVLRGQDRLAPMVIRYWALLAALHGTDKSKVNEAVDTATVMEDWPTRKYPD